MSVRARLVALLAMSRSWSVQAEEPRAWTASGFHVSLTRAHRGLVAAPSLSF